ncbi:MAG TPA: hypothetical protein VGY97_05555 [Solirubrobacteraceae bacterium]|nr:hypothetical protein [Solirubrobacteraceae bacterium]
MRIIATKPPSPSGWPEEPSVSITVGQAGPHRTFHASAVGGEPTHGPRGGYLGGQDVHAQEAEKVLTHLAAARDRAEQARRTLMRTGADPGLIDAMTDTEAHLRDAQRRLVVALDGEAPGAA